MLGLILINLIIIKSLTLLVRCFFKFREWHDYLLTVFILFFSQIILVEIFWGGIGLFYFQNIFLTHLLISLLILLFCFKKKAPPFVKPDIGFFINSNLLLFAFSVFSAFFIVKAYLNLINPPLSPDSLQYHLAFPAAWIRNGNLDNPINIFSGVFISGQRSPENSGISYFPINAELFFAWLMLPLRNAFLADLGEAPFYIIGIIAIYSILRKYSVNRRIALLSGFLWALIPNIFKQLRTASQIDVICAVLLFLVFNSLLLLKEEFTFRNALLFGISIGIFLGTKIINIIWLVSLFPLFFYLLYNVIKTHKAGLGMIALLSGAAIFMTVLFGGYMYIKNFIYTGNPLFPNEIKIFGQTIFKGLPNIAPYKVLYAVGDTFDLKKLLFKEGLGAQFLALILPSIFWPILFLGYLKKKGLRPAAEYILLFITPFIMLILYGIFLNVYVTRYLFPLISIWLITAVILISQLPAADKYFTFISFVSICASAFELAHRYELAISLLLSLAFFIILLRYKKQLAVFYGHKMFNRVILLVVLAGFIFLYFFSKKYDKEEFLRYCMRFSKKESNTEMGGGWKWLNEHTRQGARVAYTGRQEFYPLFGSGLKNYVKYVSVNAKEAIPYNNPDGLWRENKDFYAWRENLRKERIEYLFIALPIFANRESEDPTKFPIEDEWALSHPEDFQLLFSNSLVHIYRVLLLVK
ncbi:MAG: hypothetical protein NC923_03535 [Candidatus Omnitrophica bacterium]|nr:hypothetical protein [Candidatus Omnitrophota bacterium]